jgi:hypothetical protein
MTDYFELTDEELKKLSDEQVFDIFAKTLTRLAAMAQDRPVLSQMVEAAEKEGMFLLPQGKKVSLVVEFPETPKQTVVDVLNHNFEFVQDERLFCKEIASDGFAAEKEAVSDYLVDQVAAYRIGLLATAEEFGLPNPGGFVRWLIQSKH